jgi:hypothetical protein
MDEEMIETLKILKALYEDDLNAGRDLTTGLFMSYIFKLWGGDLEINPADLANFFLRQLQKLNDER